MPYWRTFYHVVWSTKERLPLISAAIEPELCASVVAAAQRSGAYVHAINGTADHVYTSSCRPRQQSPWRN